MDKIIQKLKLLNDWQFHFQDFNTKNNLLTNPLNRLEDQNVQALMKHLLKLTEQKHSKHIISWASTEYQILEIVLNSISVITSKLIEDFTNKEWDPIYNIFPYKLPLTIKYQSIRIVQQKKQHRRRWCAPQQNFLIEIVKKSLRKNKWNDVARELFIKSDGRFFRQGKHCRQRWLNHLHPSIQNNSWSRDEDIRLLSFVLKKGKKWARIAKKFCMVRSECMVKKRFYELVNMEEQRPGSSESLRNRIKTVLDELRQELNLKVGIVKQNDQSEQEIDNNQIKSSSAEESAKIKQEEEISEWQSNSSFEKGQQMKQLKEYTQEVPFGFYTGVNTIPNYYCAPMEMDRQMIDGYGQYVAYPGYMPQMIHPMHGYPAQYITEVPGYHPMPQNSSPIVFKGMMPLTGGKVQGRIETQQIFVINSMASVTYQQSL